LLIGQRVASRRRGFDTQRTAASRCLDPSGGFLASWPEHFLVGGYIAVELLYFAHSVSMAAGLPIGLGLVWLFSDVLAPSE
jgi:hypothetical protein